MSNAQDHKKKIIIKVLSDLIPFKETKIELEDINLIWGANGSGKTVFSSALSNFKSDESTKKISAPDLKDREIMVFNRSIVEKHFIYEKGKGRKKLETLVSFISDENKETHSKLEKIKQEIEDLLRKYNEIRRKNRLYEKSSSILPSSCDDLITREKNNELEKFISEDKKSILKSWKMKMTKITDQQIRQPKIKKYLKQKHEDSIFNFLKQQTKKWWNSNYYRDDKKHLLSGILQKELEEEQYQESQELRIKIGEILDDLFFTDLEKIKKELMEKNELKLNKYEKRLKNWNNNFNFVNIIRWFLDAVKVYEKKHLLTTCLLCQEKSFQLSKFKNLIRYFKKKRENSTIEQIKKKLEESEDNFVQENEEIDKTIEVMRIYSNEINIKEKEFKIRFENYKEKIKKIKNFIQKVQSFEKLEFDNNFLTLKAEIKIINNLICEIWKEIYKLRSKREEENIEKILWFIMVEKYEGEKKPETLFLNFCELNQILDNLKEKTISFLKVEKNLISSQEITDKINKYLKDIFAFNFELKQDENEEKYNIISKRSKVKIDQKSLSDGEKTTLSFLYFIEKCLQKVKEKVAKKYLIVIDDPTTSLTEQNSINLINKTLFQITELYNENQEIKFIFLSHKSLFLKNLFYDVSRLKNIKIKIQNFFIRQSINDERLEYFDSEFIKINNVKESFLTIYEHYWKMYYEIRDKYNKILVASNMRNILEIFINFYGIDKPYTFFKDMFKNNKNKFENYNSMYKTLNKMCHGQLLEADNLSYDSNFNNIKNRFEKFWEEEKFIKEHKERIWNRIKYHN